MTPLGFLFPKTLKKEKNYYSVSFVSLGLFNTRRGAPSASMFFDVLKFEMSVTSLNMQTFKCRINLLNFL